MLTCWLFLGAVAGVCVDVLQQQATCQRSNLFPCWVTLHSISRLEFLWPRPISDAIPVPLPDAPRNLQLREFARSNIEVASERARERERETWRNPGERRWSIQKKTTHSCHDRRAIPQWTWSEANIIMSLKARLMTSSIHCDRTRRRNSQQLSRPFLLMKILRTIVSIEPVRSANSNSGILYQQSAWCRKPWRRQKQCCRMLVLTLQVPNPKGVLSKTYCSMDI